MTIPLKNLGTCFVLLIYFGLFRVYTILFGAILLASAILVVLDFYNEAEIVLFLIELQITKLTTKWM